MARKTSRNKAVPQMSLPGMEPRPPAAASPEPVGTVATICSGDCRRSTLHAVERISQPDGSVVVNRKCTVCDAVEKFTVSKVVVERMSNAGQ